MNRADASKKFSGRYGFRSLTSPPDPLWMERLSDSHGSFLAGSLLIPSGEGEKGKNAFDFLPSLSAGEREGLGVGEVKGRKPRREGLP